LKKIVLLGLLLSSILYAESKFYLGLSYGILDESLTKADQTETSITSDVYALKAGYGVRSAYAIEFTLDYVNNKDPLFDANDGVKYGLNVDLLKAFDFGIYVLPFAKVGLGAGVLDTELNEGSLNYGSFNAGFGAFVPIDEHFEIEIGYNYRYMTYEKEKLETTSVNDFTPTSHINLVYLGINTRF
jgi:hypothetical protein